MADDPILSPERIKEWAERVWPCPSPDHEQIVELDGWCGACGRLAPGADFAPGQAGEVLGTWEHGGRTVATVVRGRLQVKQSLYQAAIKRKGGSHDPEDDDPNGGVPGLSNEQRGPASEAGPAD